MWLQFSKKVADGSERKFAVTESKFLPRCQNPQFCSFAPRGKLVGECLPQTLLCGLRRKNISATATQKFLMYPLFFAPKMSVVK
ncbi:hypothetical protein B5F27_11125 [Faecalibacterium sp. An192]|nr:hypothetical protein B5F27_11125 [Faecalibacterium sp. An192]